MKRIILATLILHLSMPLTENAYADTKEDLSHPYKQGQLLVRRKKNFLAKNLMHFHTKMGAKVQKTFNYPKGLELVTLKSTMTMEEGLELYNNMPGVLYAEPNYIVYKLSIPNDPMFGQQWALNNAHDIDLNAPEAWDITRGDKNVVVAIVDTGVDYLYQPELVNNIWVNSGETGLDANGHDKATNGIDDDGDGFIDNVHGVNTITHSGDPMDDDHHGTHVAGIIGAEGNNNLGVSGIAPNVTILPCKFIGSDGGTLADAMMCLEFIRDLATRATDPVHIVAINNSWGGGAFSQSMYDVIKELQDAGILFVAAAGNTPQSNDIEPIYPASYPLANIIAVASSKNDDSFSWFSSYGTHSVHLAAPGHDILSTIEDGKYATYSGTSMAAPYVTGVLALLKANNPRLNWIELKNLIMAGGQPTPESKAKTITGRRLQAFGTQSANPNDPRQGSLTCKDQIIQKILAPSDSSLTVSKGSNVEISFLNINCEKSNGEFTVSSEGVSLDFVEDNIKNGVYHATLVGDKVGNYDFQFPNGESLKVNAYDSSSWGKYEPITLDSFVYRTIVGTALNAKDDSVTPIEASFPILFGGANSGLTKLFVSSNGTISLTNQESSFINSQLPSSAYSSLIAPLWDDLTPGIVAGSDIFYDTIGVAPNREFVVEWRNVPSFSRAGNSTFEVVFFEGNGNILFNYKEVEQIGKAAKGLSATVGVQTSETSASQFSFNQALLTNNMSIMYVVTPKN